MIELNTISKYYHRGTEREIQALKQISFSAEKGEIVAITGPSGSGKSTLLHILGLLEQADEGSYYLDGEDMLRVGISKAASLRNRKIATVLQNYGLLGHLSAVQNVELPLIIAGLGRKQARSAAMISLEKMGLIDRAGEKAGLLSGGQMQRVAIARAVVSGAELLLADEPTGALSSEDAMAVMDVFISLAQEGRTVIIATHNPEVARRCGRIITLRDGIAKECSAADS